MVRDLRCTLGSWFTDRSRLVFNSALVILGRAVLERHEVYIDDNATRSSVHSPLNQAVEALDKLEKDNHLVYNCAMVIGRLSQPQSGQG